MMRDLIAFSQTPLGYAVAALLFVAAAALLKTSRLSARDFANILDGIHAVRGGIGDVEKIAVSVAADTSKTASHLKQIIGPIAGQMHEATTPARRVRLALRLLLLKFFGI
jgi:hypothetical protein